MSPYSKINPRDIPWLVKIKASPQALCSNVIDNEHMLHNTYAKGHTVNYQSNSSKDTKAATKTVTDKLIMYFTILHQKHTPSISIQNIPNCSANPPSCN